MLTTDKDYIVYVQGLYKLMVSVNITRGGGGGWMQEAWLLVYACVKCVLGGGGGGRAIGNT